MRPNEENLVKVLKRIAPFGYFNTNDLYFILNTTFYQVLLQEDFKEETLDLLIEFIDRLELLYQQDPGGLLIEGIVPNLTVCDVHRVLNIACRNVRTQADFEFYTMAKIYRMLGGFAAHMEIGGTSYVLPKILAKPTEEE